MLLDVVDSPARPRARTATFAALLALVLPALALGSPQTARAQSAPVAETAARIADGLAVVAGGLAADDRGAITAGGVGPQCPGDCDGNGVVSVDEMVRGVLIAAGAQAVGSCPAFDLDGNGMVSVNELIAGIRRALEGCTGSGAVSVCGGPITSAPKLCNLRIEPARVQTGTTVNISFGISDLEGDVTTVCLGFRQIGGQATEQCEPGDPFGMTVNLVVELPGIPINLPPGDYELAILVIDDSEARSEIVTARFTVFRLRR